MPLGANRAGSEKKKKFKSINEVGLYEFYIFFFTGMLWNE